MSFFSLFIPLPVLFHSTLCVTWSLRIFTPSLICLDVLTPSSPLFFFLSSLLPSPSCPQFLSSFPLPPRPFTVNEVLYSVVLQSIHFQLNQLKTLKGTVAVCYWRHIHSQLFPNSLDMTDVPKFLVSSSFLFHSTPCLRLCTILSFTLIFCVFNKSFLSFFSRLKLVVCFFINHLHPYYSLSPLISSPFLHNFLLSFPPKYPHILLLPVILSLSLWGLLVLFWGLFSSLSCQKEIGCSDVPNHDKQVICLPQKSLYYKAHTHKYLNAKQMG